MALYHICSLDGEDHIGARKELGAGSDREAMDSAAKFLARHPEIPGVAVWLGERLIVRLCQPVPR